MDETDKTYMWLVLITFFALVLAGVISFVELSDLKEPLRVTSDPYGASGG